MQEGNAKPRVFKIPEYEAIIQRLGFNNEGIEALLRNIKISEEKILGINITKIKIQITHLDYKFLYKIVQSCRLRNNKYFISKYPRFERFAKKKS